MSISTPLTNFISDPTFKGATDEAVSPSQNNTDVIAPEFKLYIEGVQVPFESMSINQSYRGYPTADIQIPPESGLIDITKGYEPKVHIFYNDVNYGGDRLLFWGFIKSTSYSRSRNQGSTSVTFHCEHKNSILEQIVLEYSGWATNVNESASGPTPQKAGVKPSSFNSEWMIVQALSGLDGIASPTQVLSRKQGPTNLKNAPVNKLDPSLALFETRLMGMPGIIVNMWNQIKKTVYTNPKNSVAMTAMYIPILEESLAYFKRMSGHTFLEAQLQKGKLPYCHTRDGQEINVIVPPYFQGSMISAVQREMSAKSVQSIIGFSGELTNFIQLVNQILDVSKYEMLTLASPAEISRDPAYYIDLVNVDGVEKSTIETIVKPQMPFYFAPVCNVLLPRMYTAILITQDNSSVPTRVAAVHDAIPGQTGPDSLGSSYKAPHSIREATAYNVMLNDPTNGVSLNLNSTKSITAFIPGKYEQGIGIKSEKLVLPHWLALLAGGKSTGGTTTNQEQVPPLGTPEYNNLMSLTVDWQNRFGRDIIEQDANIQVVPNIKKNNLNPFDPLNKTVLPFERILYSSMDYEYSKRVAASRNGTIEAVFNPYIIPGYPMDVIDDSPNHPSFHGLCTSVTHTITSRSVSTTIGIAAATTYAELSNYYTPPIYPFLMTSLNIVNSTVNSAGVNSGTYGDPKFFMSATSTILENSEAKKTADTFYRQVLGVGAVAPDDLIHFASGRSYPVQRNAGILVPQILPDNSGTPNLKAHPRQAREKEDYYSTVGNLKLVSRPIESRDSIETKFDYTFIDLTPELYNSSFINYVNPILAKDIFIEPGASLFLDYTEIEDFIKNLETR
jgi:hypothetical protein